MKKNVLSLFIISVLIFVLLIVINNFTFIGGQLGVPIDQVDPSMQWEFFEKQLLNPQQAAEAYGTGQAISFPHKFKEQYGTTDMYGTYVAKVKLPHEENVDNLAIYVPFQYGSYKLYVNNQFIAKNGVVGTTKEQQVPENAPKIGQIHTRDEEVYITLQLSNFYSLRGGFLKPLYVGDFSEFVNKHNSTMIFHFFINGIIFVASIFAFLLGFFNNRNKQTILFALFCLVISIRSVFARPFFYSITVLDVPWEAAVKVESICTVLAVSLAISFLLNALLPTYFKRLFWIAQSLLAIQLVLILFTEPLVFQQANIYTFTCALLLLFYIFIKGVVTYKTFTLELAVHFIGSFVIFMAAVHDWVVIQEGKEVALLVQHSQAVYVMLICVMISIHYAQKQKQEQCLKNEILALNASLDLKIKERTVQLEEANKTLNQLATKDALTGIANRYAFDQQLERSFEHAIQTKQNVSLLLIDLDAFKKYNDCYGHVMGDALLQQVVSVIAKQLPEETFFARYGGEEFAIIYPNADEEQLTKLGEKIVESVAKQRLEHIHNTPGYATISVGGYTMTANNLLETKKQFITAADERLYSAKKNGKNQFMK